MAIFWRFCILYFQPMQVRNVLHVARWKYRTQKIAKNSPSGPYRTTLSGCVFAIKARIDYRHSEKNLLNSNVFHVVTIWRTWPTPFPSNRHHRCNGDCLEGKRENYQVCFVQYCVQQLYTVNYTHIWTELTVLWIGFCLTGPISLCLDLFLCMYYFVSDCILHECVVL